MIVRDATAADVAAIVAFGAAHVPDHYRPLIGDEAAQAQVDVWWTNDRIGPAAADGRVAVAEDGGEIVGVAEWSMYDGTPVIWKLYVHPERRRRGIGARLLRHVVAQVPPGTKRLRVEHFAANTRAGRFYDRESFRYVETVPHASDPRQSVVWRELDLAD